MRPGKPNRIAEGPRHAAFCASIDIPTLGNIAPPGTTEAGDILWLDPKTLLIGHGYRTNAAGIQQMRALLAPTGVEVLSAPLPYGPGPSACLHLMSLISLLDEHTALVDLPWLAVETVELLKSRGFNFIEIDPSERDTLACNVLALGNNRLLAIEENQQHKRPPPPSRIRPPHLPRQRTLHQRQRRPDVFNAAAAPRLSTNHVEIAVGCRCGARLAGSIPRLSALLLKLSSMLLPFVRELFTDVEMLPAFARVASHLKEGTGRIRVSGLTPPQKPCCSCCFNAPPPAR